MVGEYRFAVGSSKGLALQSGEVATEGVVVTSVLRWTMFTGLALALGGLIAAWLASQSATATERLPHPWTRAGSSLGLAAAVGLALLVVGGAGSLSTRVERFSFDALTASTPGLVALGEVGAFGAALVLFLLHRRFLGGVVLLLVSVLEGVRAHPQASAGGVGVALTVVHLAAAAVWVGRSCTWCASGWPGAGVVSRTLCSSGPTRGWRWSCSCWSC